MIDIHDFHIGILNSSFSVPKIGQIGIRKYDLVELQCEELVCIYSTFLDSLMISHSRNF